MVAHIIVTKKDSVPDPESRGAKEKTSFCSAVSSVRAGKYFQVTINEHDPEKVRAVIDELCLKLLTNPIYEQYEFTIE